MKKKQRYWLRVSVLTLFVLMLGFAIFQSVLRNQAGTFEEGDLAPDFTAQTMDGEQVRLSDLKGQGVLINFWASWCKPCKDEMPAIERRYQKHKEKGLTVLAVNVGESPLTVQGFVRGFDLSFPILLDPEKEVTKLYNIGPLPASLFIDPDGKIYRKVTGQMSETFIEQNVIKVLPQD